MKDRLLSLSLSITEAVRRNHAIEHATLNLLAEKGYQLSGISDAGGFFTLGKVPTELLFNTAQQAVERLSAGESRLAVHAHCGTNYAASGVVAGLAAWFGMAGANSARKRWSRLPFVIALSTLAFIFSQPLGPWLQRKVTTIAQMDVVKITGIVQREIRKIPIHRVYIRHGKG